MLQAYLDDSGNDQKSPVFIIAGYLAYAEKWESFSYDWQKILDLKEPAPLPKLRMNDAMGLRRRRSPFFGWSEYERDERLKKFVRPINLHVEHGFCFCMSYEAWRYATSSPYWPTSMDRPYKFLFFESIAKIISVSHALGYDQKVEFIFDSQYNISKSDFVSAYDQFKSLCPQDRRDYLSDFPRFERDEDYAPLQAADMLAWHFRQEYFRKNDNSLNSSYPSNTYLANIFRPKHDLLVLWDHVEFDRILSALQESARKKSEEQKARAIVSLQSEITNGIESGIAEPFDPDAFNREMLAKHSSEKPPS